MTRDDIIRMAREANRYAASQTDDSLDFPLIRDERFAALVAALAEEQNYVNRWISVEENLPKEGQLVLGLYYKSNITIVYRKAREIIDDRWVIEDGWVEPSSGHSLIPPTHWMPLPEYEHVHKMESKPTIKETREYRAYRMLKEAMDSDRENIIRNMPDIEFPTEFQKRKPLTAPQIHELDWPNDVAFEDILEFVRAIERAHGIGVEE